MPPLSWLLPGFLLWNGPDKSAATQHSAILSFHPTVSAGIHFPGGPVPYSFPVSELLLVLLSGNSPRSPLSWFSFPFQHRPPFPVSFPNQLILHYRESTQSPHTGHSPTEIYSNHQPVEISTPIPGAKSLRHKQQPPNARTRIASSYGEVCSTLLSRLYANPDAPFSVNQQSDAYI